ncbi:phage holin family protein [Altererythrobacter litoralis]|uniref:Phage holin family protein n=1 Tax=Altererythrobacter litoralis TaxID=3113904 RepID=A0ABU7GFR6_9SPHN|nr:phage holin family protein [Erythrobacteraceae bacterium 1XM1-14]
MRDEDRADPRPVDVDDELDAALRGDEDGQAQPDGSLVDDVAALVQDGRNFVEAEIAFQKTRLAFAANRSKSAVVSGLFALAFIHLALIALVVGLVIALTPLVSALGATAIVVGLLLFGAFLMLMRMRNSTQEIGDAFGNDNAEGGK